METLFVKHDRLIAKTSLDIVREMMNRVHWDARLLSIQGAKGVGKSTLLKQFVKQNYQPGDRKVLYCSADTIDFSRRTLVDLAGEFAGEHADEQQGTGEGEGFGDSHDGGGGSFRAVASFTV